MAAMCPKTAFLEAKANGSFWRNSEAQVMYFSIGFGEVAGNSKPAQNENNLSTSWFFEQNRLKVAFC